MKSLYLLLNIGSISVPFLYSFHPKMNFKKHWQSLSISTIIVAILYIVWDYIFTKNGVWGFNENYNLGIEILGMPFEEILFFFCIPYASIFTHYAVLHFKPNWKLSIPVTKAISIAMLILSVILIGFFYEKMYTLVNFSFLIIAVAFGWFIGMKELRTFYISFLFILIPFFIVNGILTGSFIEAPVVWYNNYENLGIRLFTIPMEDLAYAFSMIFMNIMIMNRLEKNHDKI